MFNPDNKIIGKRDYFSGSIIHLIKMIILPSPRGFWITLNKWQGKVNKIKFWIKNGEVLMGIVYYFLLFCRNLFFDYQK